MRTRRAQVLDTFKRQLSHTHHKLLQSLFMHLREMYYETSWDNGMTLHRECIKSERPQGRIGQELENPNPEI